MGLDAPVAVKLIAAVVTFAIAKVCGSAEVPVVATNTRPPGDTCEGAAVPAGTMLSTTVMEIGG